MTQTYEMPYVDHGVGRPVLFVHGSLQDHRAWNPILQSVAERYRAIAVDLRYCGATDWPDEGENYALQVHIDDLAAFVRGLDAGPVPLVGWSYGGAASLALAIQNPGLVERLFLYEPAPIYSFVTRPEDVATISEDAAARVRDGVALFKAGDLPGATRALVNDTHTDEGFFDRLPTEARTMILENARTLPPSFAAPPPPLMTADELFALDIPVTIAIGGQTREFFKIIARTACELLPRAELKIVDNAKHLWPTLEPNAFCRLLLDFLDHDAG